MTSLRKVGKLPYIVGHRGARGLAPENTIAAFQKGFEMKVDLIECDVHLDRDGDVVVIHDETVNRTTNGSGRVNDLSRAEISSLTSGWGERIPYLNELLHWLSKREDGKIVIEMKGNLHLYPSLPKKVVDLLTSFQMIHRAIVISFDLDLVRDAKETDSLLKTGFLVSQSPESAISLAHQAKSDSLWPSLKILSPELVKLAHQNELAVFTWNANEKSDFIRAVEAGVDGVGSDFPDLIQKWLAEI